MRAAGWAGKDGNVYRRGENGWEQNNGKGWQGADSGRANSLDRERNARTQGGERAQPYRSGGYRSAGARGGSRGGGGGGRRR